MTFKHFFTEREVIFTISVVVFVCIVGGSYLLNHHKHTTTETPIVLEQIGYQGTLSGEYLCLPHTDTTGPQTLECAFGIKTETGEYYALDLNTMSEAAMSLKTGDHISAAGVITPLAMLSSDHWRNYPIVGIFSVTDSFNINDKPVTASHTLNDKVWEWEETLYNDGTRIAPKKSGVFMLTFRDRGQFSTQTDCNSVGGRYVADENRLMMATEFRTEMFCKDALEEDYTKAFGAVASYFFNKEGKLILELKYDSGTMIFR